MIQTFLKCWISKNAPNLPEEITSEILQVMSDTVRHLRPLYSCNLNRRHNESLGACNASHSAPDSWNQGHPQAAHWTATNAAITAYLQRTLPSSDFWRRIKRTVKWTLTPFRNVATDHSRLLKATEISLFIPRKLLHPYCPPEGGVTKTTRHTSIWQSPFVLHLSIWQKPSRYAITTVQYIIYRQYTTTSI